MKIRASKGFSLLEVLIAVVILSIGLLAVASLQGRLLKNTSDTNARTIAMNIGQGLMERFRSVLTISPDVATANPELASGDFGFDDIATGDLGDIAILGGDESATTVTIGNAVFTPSWTVTDCWRDGLGSFSCGAATDDSAPDFKKVSITVSWTDAEVDVGAGEENPSIVLEEVIAQVLPGDSGILVDDLDLKSQRPVVNYTPQPAPEVVKIPIGLGAGRFKETTEPAPDILRNEFSTLTTFSTITFDEDGSDFLARRQEDFLMVNCRCTLQSGEIEGQEPIVWNGDEYVEALLPSDADGNPVANSKPWGAVSSTVSAQPDLCADCCANHHDSDQSVESFDPFRLSDPAAGGDHRHFLSTVDADEGQVLTEAILGTTNEEYDEVCRFLRIDGRFKLAQDFQLVAFNVLPQSQLEDATKLAAYQTYVVDLVSDYLGQIGTDCDGTVAAGCYPGDLPDTSVAPFTQAAIDTTLEETMVSLANFASSVPDEDTRPKLATYDADGDGELSDAELATFHQDFGLKPFLARGVYVDYINDYVSEAVTSDVGLRECIDIRRGAIATPADVPTYCDPATGSVLDIVPFYEVNITGLTFWKITGGDYLMLYQGIADGIEEVYRRGDVRLFSETDENALVLSSSELSNSGLTDTLGIDEADRSDDLEADALIDGVTNAEQVVKVLSNLSIANNVSNVLPANVITEGIGMFSVNPGDQQKTAIAGEVDCSSKEAESVLKCVFDPAELTTDNLAIGFGVTGYVRDPDADGVYDDHFICASMTPANQLRDGETQIDLVGKLEVIDSGLTTETTQVFVGGTGDFPFPHCGDSLTACPENLTFVLNISVKKTGSC